jgi:HPt (histidine-containing phosphotransfer) domain-containing protein
MTHINLDYLKTLAKDDTDFLVFTIEAFLEQIFACLPVIEGQATSKDWKGLLASLHKLKSSLDIMGMKKGHQITEQIEFALRSQTSLDFIEDWTIQLAAECRLASTELFELKKMYHDTRN